MSKEKIQTRSAQLRAEGIDDENRTVEFVISTEAVDSYGTVFLLDGWDLEEYKRNPIVCYNHDSFRDPDKIIGTSEVYRDGDELIGKLTFEDADTNPFAEKIFRKVKSGTLRMASINARVSKARMGLKDQGEDPDVVYFTRSILKEWSIVSIGSNPEAFKRNEEGLQTLRSDAKKDSEIPKEKNTGENNYNTDKKRALTRFEAQLIVNQNSVK